MRLREGALQSGLDANAIAGQLRYAFAGATAAKIQVGVEAYAVDVRLAATDRDELADLRQFTVRAPGGKDIPLTTVAMIEPVRGYGRIQHVRGRRTVTVQGNLDPRQNSAADIVRHTSATFLPGLRERFPELHLSFQGEAKENAKTGTSILRAVLIGLFGIFAILSFEFRGYREPLLVMAIIPMGLIGTIWGHLAMGLTFTMPSVLGLVSLAGIAVNDSIILVTFIREQRRAGLGPLEAAAQASRARFRAVLLTSATTVAGLLPLLLERSVQAQVLKPLVASIAFGLTVTTVMVLFLIPALYGILSDFNWTRPVETE